MAPLDAPATAGATARRSIDPIFGCEDISLELGGRSILRGISLSVRPGEVLGVIGPNGAGKTSLFEVLSGRISPKAGRVFFGERTITRLRAFERARLGIGRTYQTPVVPEDLTVGETLKAARQAYKPFLSRFHAEWGLELVGFHAPYDAMAGSLEALNRRKLLLACLMMRRCSVLLLDEPAAGLINSEVDEIDHLIRKISKEMNVAIVIVEHRIELLETIADRAMVLDAGETIAAGDLADLLDDPAVHAAYFEEVTEGALE